MTLNFTEMKAKHIITSFAAAAMLLSSCNGLLDIPQKGVLNYETYYRPMRRRKMR